MKKQIALILVLAISSSAIAADWPDTRMSGPFVCHSDFSLQSLEPFLQELAQLPNELAWAINIPSAKEAIEVYLFHDRQTYERYLKQHYPNVPFRRAVYIKGRGLGRVFAYHSTQFEIDLRHECIHALLHATMKNIPLWLDEGLAVYFELPSENRVADNPHLNSVRWNAWLGIAPKIETLEKCNDIAKMGKTEYRNSWAWVYYMLQGPAEAHEELVLYLSDLQSQKSPILLSARLKRRIPGMEKSFVSFYRR